MCFNFQIPCSSVAFASMSSTGFNSYPKSCSSDTVTSDSDAPHAAAYSSVSALLFAMIFCLRVCAFREWLPGCITPALDDFWVSFESLSSLFVAGPI